MARPAFVDHTVLRMALIGYEQEKAKIEAAIADVRTRLGDSRVAATAINGTAAMKRKMSAVVRRRMAMGQKRRWAAARVQKAETAKPADKPKRKFSAAARKAMGEATKRRWAAFRKVQQAAA